MIKLNLKNKKYFIFLFKCVIFNVDFDFVILRNVSQKMIKGRLYEKNS